MSKTLFRILLPGSLIALLLAACAAATPSPAPAPATAQPAAPATAQPPAPATTQPAAAYTEQPLATVTSQPATTLVGSRLLFSRFAGANHDFSGIFISMADGSGVANTPLTKSDINGRWSWSGAQIAVGTELPDGRIGTIIHSPDGSVLRVLEIPDATLNTVCTIWSRDDTRLACQAWDDASPARAGIYSVRASDGEDLQRLTTPPAGILDEPGDYSPDGQLVFKRINGDEGPGDLMLVKAGGESRLLYKGLMRESGRFSPDGRYVATSMSGRLEVISLDGKVLYEIFENGKFFYGPAWSPDGSRIAFSVTTVGYAKADIFTSMPDGSDRQQVTKTPEDENSVD